MKNKKVLIPEEMPEFQRSIDALSQESIDKVDALLKKQEEEKCEGCNGEGSIEGKTGGSEGVPEADVLFVCQECNGTGKVNLNQTVK